MGADLLSAQSQTLERAHAVVLGSTEGNAAPVAEAASRRRELPTSNLRSFAENLRDPFALSRREQSVRDPFCRAGS